jgi:hypothetical protein
LAWSPKFKPQCHKSRTHTCSIIAWWLHPVKLMKSHRLPSSGPISCPFSSNWRCSC